MRVGGRRLRYNNTQSAEAFWIHRIAYVPFLEERPPEARLNSNLLELIGPSHD